MTKLIEHRGVPMTLDWPERIAEAQRETHVTSGGVSFARIPYGADDPRWGELPCRQCGVIKGELHVPDCQYDHCPVCGEFGYCKCWIDGKSEKRPAPTLQDRVVAKLQPVATWALVAVIALCLGAIVWAFVTMS
jgi:hypothetical protein